MNLLQDVLTRILNVPIIFSNALDSAGASLEVAQFTERLVPSTRFVAVDNVAPAIADSAAFVAPSASVIGDVTLGKNSR